MPVNVLATFALLRPRSLRFHVTPKGRTGDDRHRMPVPRLLVAIVMASFAALLWFAATMAEFTPLRYAVPWAAYGAACWLCINTMLVIYAIGRIRSSRYGTDRRRSIRFETALSGFFDEQACDICDVSLTGALIRVPASHMDMKIEPVTVRTNEAPNVLTIVFDDVQIRLHAMIRSQHVLPAGQTQYGLEFCEDQSWARARLALALFNEHYIPEIEEAPQTVYGDWASSMSRQREVTP
jgi:cellulose synthase (UDP-forming)